MPSQLLTYRVCYDNTGYDNYIQNRPHDCRGHAKAQGTRAKLTTQLIAAQSKQSEEQSDTKGDQQLVLLGTPLRGPDILNLCI
jgi:hypothetical protein